MQNYDGGVVADEATGRPMVGRNVKVFDEETDAPIQAYREGQPVTLVTGAHGLIGQFQTEDSTRRVRIEVGPVRLRQWSQEMIASAADASGSISSALEQVEVARSEAAAIVPRMEQIETMAGLAPGEVTDAQTANLVSRQDTDTRAALDAATAQAVGGRAPLPLVGVNVRALGASEPRPVAFWDGKLYGALGATIAASTDEGQTWTTLTTTATGPSSTGGIIDMEPTVDGEVLALTPTRIYKSTGWGTGAITWTVKVQTNTANSPFQPWSLDGDGTKFIAAEYNVGGTGYWADSRYAHISTDGGSTWKIVYDTLALHGATQNGQSHLHGVAYDRHRDVFYLSEGHGPAVGIYVSTDNGATWTRSKITSNVPAHTALVATKAGLVASSDTTLGGTYGAASVSPPSQMVENRTWAWQPGYDGTLGFGVRGEEDPETGVVYFGYRVETANTPPFIAASSVSAGAMVYEWDRTFAALGDVRGVWPVGKGRIVALVIPNNSAPERYLLTATAPNPGAVNTQGQDFGQVMGGTVRRGDSLAVGPLSSTGSVIRGTAVGVRATTTGSQDATAVGNASVAAGSSTAVGHSANAETQGTAVGQAAKTVGTNSTAVGNAASASAGAGTAVGGNSKAGNGGTALGSSSEAVGFAQAFGYGAKAVHAGATVLANLRSSTAANQAKLGDQHIEQGLNSPVAPEANHGRQFLRKDANGKIEACWRFPTGDVQVIASEVNVAKIPSYTSGARPPASAATSSTSSTGVIRDSTLNKLLFSDGTVWRDAMGTAV